MNDIILGFGVFAIDGTDVALTRGGGKFAIERKYKEIVADGDMGAVKGRIRKDESRAKLMLKALEILSDDMIKFYPAMSTTGTTTKTTIGADITDADYHTVTFTGETADGKSIIITLENAINLENLDWTFVDKDEVVAEINYQGAYLYNARNTEPWSIQYVDDSLVPPVMSLVAPADGTSTNLVLMFDEPLHADTFNITDRFALLSSVTNDSVVVAITTLSNSVEWFAVESNTPFAVVVIASTVFVEGKTVRVNAKASAIKDIAGNSISASTNSDAVVTA